MGWRFCKSFIPLPSVRLTLSPRGLSTSVRVGPLRLTVGPQGGATTERIPSTGIAYNQPLTVRSLTSQVPPPPPPPSPRPPQGDPPKGTKRGGGEMGGAGTSELT